MLVTSIASACPAEGFDAGLKGHSPRAQVNPLQVLPGAGLHFGSMRAEGRD